jgi:hypothetical protein
MAAMATALMDSLLAPADVLRRGLLRRVPRRLLTDRELRVGLGGVFGLLTALALAGVAPLWTLSLGPLLLGVPHIVADARYLVARPGLHRRWLLLGALAVPAALYGMTGRGVAGLAAGAFGVLACEGTLGRRLAAMAVALGLMLGAYEGGLLADLAMIHLHNAVAVGLWWAWRPRRGLLAAAVPAGAALGVALILGGALDGPPVLSGPASGWSLDLMAWSVAGDASPVWAMRWVMVYAFGQGLHYALWLRLVPDDDRGRATPRSFRASWAALVGDLGLPFLGGMAALFTGLLLYGWAHAGAARLLYLQLTGFHAYLEVALALVAWAEHRRPGERWTPSSAT